VLADLRIGIDAVSSKDPLCCGIEAYEAAIPVDGVEPVLHAFQYRCDARLAMAPQLRKRQVRFYPRHEFAGRERLYEIIVCACFDTFDARLLARAGGHHHDRDRCQAGIASNGCEKPEAVQLRHHDVSEDEIGRLALYCDQRCEPQPSHIA
jgi:hypothetical protein